jgi:exopolyphosphatase / guanosine-5'-triphosphate,3'-diphosphate pyrophosphatase
MPEPTVAVIDIGSNSIKVLVAARGDDGGIATLFSRTIEARISAGISRENPQLSNEGMQRGVDAVAELLGDAAPFAPIRAQIVATSAVRDAVNGAEFSARVLQTTGFEIKILSGGQEANAIGHGLTCDPALAHLRDFYLFDLGGGSLECLSFARRDVTQALSLPLGCVRLTEKFIPDPAAPVPVEIRKRIMTHTRRALVESGFRFGLPEPVGVATGGTVATVRAIVGARASQPPQITASLIPVWRLREILETLAPLALEQRRQVPGVPAARADILPAALATLIAVAETATLTAFHHSFYNLRYGLAAELLAEL